ncbi:hydroxysteroid dehydrogenase-like protein 2 [Paramormyrops kingsleyae]|uniref:hydroxysteroid dehydrogenase-like protein 2 n=1 Tax=Paramormyrops kingsleyae TaxID=1676925 RepID=UPI003B96A24B
MLPNTGKLAGRTLFITGASRGIGKAIALKAARDGANVVIAAKTAQPHPKLPGTIYTAAEEIQAAGGKALPCVVDIRDENQISNAVEQAVKKFGGIDILINNASAINLTGTVETPMKKVDLMLGINLRGTYLTSKLCIPYLLKSKNPHILNLSPPLNLNPVWFKNHTAYTMAKYGMSMCVLGMAEEFRGSIAVNALWPKTAIQTAAMDMLGGSGISKQCRKVDIIADAAYSILNKPTTYTGNFTIDEDILRAEGISDFDTYAVVPGHPLLPDFFLDSDPEEVKKQMVDEGTMAEQANAGGMAGGPIAATFKAIQGILSPDVIKTTQGVYKFNITGDDAGVWYIDLKNAPGSAGFGEPPNGEADVIMTLDGVDFIKMFKGQLKPTMAFMSGKLKIKGDMTLAIKMEKMMTMMTSKL